MAPHHAAASAATPPPAEHHHDDPDGAAVKAAAPALQTMGAVASSILAASMSAGRTLHLALPPTSPMVLSPEERAGLESELFRELSRRPTDVHPDDKATPDAWVQRSPSHLIRLTGELGWAWMCTVVGSGVVTVYEP